MMPKFDTPRKSSSNKESCNQHITYLGKEDKMKGELHKEYFFNHIRDMIGSHRVQGIIDGNVKGLAKTDAKFYTGSISLSPKELEHIDNDPKKLKQFCLEFFRLYSRQFNRGFSRDDFNYFCKLESNRYYKSNDPLVKSGKVKTGDPKPGKYNMHVHFIVGRLTKSGKKASPKTNHRSNSRGAVKSSFSRDDLFQQAEELFDKMFQYARPLTERYKYYNQLKNGSSFQKKVVKNNHIDSELDYKIFIASSSEKKVQFTKSKMEQINYKLQEYKKEQLNGQQILGYSNEVLNGKLFKQLQNFEWLIKQNELNDLEHINQNIIDYLEKCKLPFNGTTNSIDKTSINTFVQIVNQELSKEFALSNTYIFPNSTNVDLNVLDCLIEGVSNNRKALLKSIFRYEKDTKPTIDIRHSLVDEINSLYKDNDKQHSQKLTMEFISELNKLNSDQEIKSGLLALKGILKFNPNDHQNLNLLLFSILKNLEKKYNEIPKVLRLQQLRKYVNYLNSKIKGKVECTINIDQVLNAEIALNYNGKSLAYLNAINSKIKKEDYDGAKAIILQSAESFIKNKLYHGSTLNQRAGTEPTHTSGFFDDTPATSSLFPTLSSFFYREAQDDYDEQELIRKRKKRRKKPNN